MTIACVMASSSVGLSELDALLKPFIDARAAGGRSNRPQQDKVVLSIFDIPPGLLGRLSPASPTKNGPSAVGTPAAAATAESAGSKRGLTCLRCGLSFDDRPAQLAHFKSKLHMTNLRRQLSGQRPILQQELDTRAFVQGTAGEGNFAGDDGGDKDSQEDSDSGSDSETERSTVGVTTEVADTFDEGDIADGLALARAASVDEIEETVSRTAPGVGDGAIRGDAPPTRGNVKVDFGLHEGPRLVFTPTGSTWCFSLSSAALGMERGSDPWERLDALLGEEAEGANNRLWAVLIVQSGKFAAAVFEGQSVVCHKVLKRYTIRAKRGGSQSSYDSGGRKAQSAGATLRRYGEQSLREDARALLKDWQEPLKACCVVLTSVPKNMRALLFEGKDAPFDRKDHRLRPIPFAVGRPVFEEVVAVHTKITSIAFTEAATADVEDSRVTATPGASNKEGVGELDRESPKPTSMSVARDDSGLASESDSGTRAVGTAGGTAADAVESDPCPPSEELIEACEQGDVTAVVALLDRLELTNNNEGTGSGGVALPVPPTVDDEGAPIPGQVGTGDGSMVGWTVGEVINRPDGLERLLSPLHVASEGGHSAVIATLLERGASPLAEDVRGRVPYLLAANKETRDAFRRARAAQPERWDWATGRVPEPLTEELEQRKKEKLKEKEKEKRKRAKQRKKEEKANAEERERQRKAKEKAEAEERKARGLAAKGHCDSCGKGLIEKKAFRRFEFTYCTTDCANAHKRKLAADAAERRFNQG